MLQTLELPADFVEQSMHIGLMGHAGKRKVQNISGVKTVALPKIYRQCMAEMPALVLYK